MTRVLWRLRVGARLVVGFGLVLVLLAVVAAFGFSAGADVVVEGVGAAWHELTPYAQVIVWVQTDRAEARRRGLERDVRLGREPAEAVRFWDEWMQSEEPFLEAERPWTRADLVVDGASEIVGVAATVQTFVPVP